MHARQLTLADLAAYRALHRFALIEAPHAFVETLAQDQARSDAPVAEMLARGEGWGVFEGERLLGKLVIDALPYQCLSHTRWLHAIYLHPETRGAGAGAALMNGAMAHAQHEGAFCFLLWVNEKNAVARRFYEKLRFQEIGRVDKGIAAPEGGFVDDVLMCRALSVPVT